MKDFKSVSIAVILLSAGSYLLPIQNEFKVVTGLSGLAASCHLIGTEATNERKRKEQLEQTRKELHNLDVITKLAQIELENKQAQLELEFEAIASVKTQNTLQMNSEKEIKLAELVSLERQSKEAIEEYKDSTKKELEAEKESIKHTLESELAKLNQDYADVRSSLARRVWNMRRRLLHKFIRLQNDQAIGIESAINSGVERIRFIDDATKMQTETFRNQLLENAESEIDASSDILLDTLKEEKKLLREKITNEFVLYMLEQITEVNKLNEEIAAYKEETEYLKGKLYQEMQPILIKRPRNDGDRKTNDLLTWLFKDWGIVTEYVSGGMNSDYSLTVNFELTKDQEKLSKKIGRLRSKELPVQLQAYFGSVTEPVIETNIALGCWTATIPPTEGGARPKIDDFKLVPSVVAKPTSFDSLESTLKEQIQERETYAQLEKFMLDFVPVCPLPVPTEPTVSNQELSTIRWFYMWRSQSSDGKLTDIVSVEGILREVYGIADGNFIVTGTNETLSQRIERIFQQIRLEMIDLNYG